MPMVLLVTVGLVLLVVIIRALSRTRSTAGNKWEHRNTGPGAGQFAQAEQDKKRRAAGWARDPGNPANPNSWLNPANPLNPNNPANPLNPNNPMNPNNPRNKRK